ncbi:MAG: chloride channel protein [Promethearchaeota archaeon]
MSLTPGSTFQSSNSVKRWLVLSGLAIVMGIIGGLFAVLLRFLIVKITWFFLEFLLAFITINVGGYNLGYIILPATGGLIVGIIINNYAHETKGSGIPVLLESITFRRASLSAKVGLFKTIVTAITIGSGGSAGREGPIALIGASFGSFFGKKLKLNPEDKRLLMACGLAAGIAGSFNAPIGGALFGLEILYQGITLFASIPVFLAAVIGVLIAGNLYGFEAIFSIDVDISSIHPIEFSFFIIVGILCGIIAYYHFVIYRVMEKGFRHLKIPSYLKPALGGALVGIAIMFYPTYGLFGSGFEGIQLALDAQFSLWLLLILGLLKIFTIGSTIASGGSGGVFSPLLFIGCMFGGAMGILLEMVAPNIVSNPILYCILGAAAVFSASAQAPLNICLVLAEMTQHFDVFPPLLVTSITSFLVGRVFFKGSSIYTLTLGEKGHDLKTDTIYLLGKAQVHEFMSANLITVSPNLPILEFARVSMQNHDLNQFPVMNFGKLEGVVYLDNLYSIPYENWDQITVKEIMESHNISISTKATLQEAMDMMNEFDRPSLLVTELVQISDSEEEQILKGILTMNDVIRAWQQSHSEKQKSPKHQKNNILH